MKQLLFIALVLIGSVGYGQEISGIWINHDRNVCMEFNNGIMIMQHCIDTAYAEQKFQVRQEQDSLHLTWFLQRGNKEWPFLEVPLEIVSQTESTLELVDKETEYSELEEFIGSTSIKLKRSKDSCKKEFNIRPKRISHVRHLDSSYFKIATVQMLVDTLLHNSGDVFLYSGIRTEIGCDSLFLNELKTHYSNESYSAAVQWYYWSAVPIFPQTYLGEQLQQIGLVIEQCCEKIKK